MNFTHLHNHSDISNDGVGLWSLMVNRCKEAGQTSLGLTDHGSLGGIPRHIIECNLAGIKPIVGIEAYVDYEDIGHLTILADGEDGFHNLVELQNKAVRCSDKQHAPIKLDWIKEFNKGLYILSGCMASPFQRLPYPEALRLLNHLNRDLEPGHLFVETMLVLDNLDTFERSLQLASDSKLPLLVSNDCHYANKADLEVRDLLMRIKGHTYPGQEIYLKSYQEMLDRCDALHFSPVQKQVVEMGMRNAYDLSLLIKTPKILQKQGVPEIPDANIILANKIYNSIKEKGLNKEYYDRASYELSTLEKFSSYILIVEDIVKTARDMGIPANARGSGGGSLVLYLLGISNFDPIQYHCTFERFINPKRSKYPDIDLDVAAEYRHEIIDYVAKKYNGTPVIAYNTYQDRSLIKALSPILHFTLNEEEELAALGESASCYAEAVKKAPILPHAMDVLRGTISHVSQHAAGVVLPLQGAELPLANTKGGDKVAAYNESANGKEYLSQAGFTKFDILGLDALTALTNMFKDNGISPLPHMTSIDDKKKIFKSALSGEVEGIFQLSDSIGMRKLLMRILDAAKFSEDFFEHIVATISLYRPAALRQVDEYINNIRNGYIDYGIPYIDDLLKITHGVCIYQEQMMSIVAYVLSIDNGKTIDLADADLARRLIVKFKDNDLSVAHQIADLKAKFMSCTHVPQTLLKKLWQVVEDNCGYGFNRSHAVAYAIIAWQMWYCKIKNPVSFFTHCLNADDDKLNVYLMACANHNIEIVPPHVNVSTEKFTNDGTKIYCPITIIKGIGSTGAKALVDARSSGLFVSLKNFRERVAPRAITSSAAIKLLELGALSGVVQKDEDVNKIVRPTNKWLGCIELIEQLQMKYIGYVIPSLRLVEQLDKALTGGKHGGIIVSYKEKESTYGNYTSYTFINGDRFWIRETEHSFDIGDIIICDTVNNSGKAMGLKEYNYDTIYKV